MNIVYFHVHDQGRYVSTYGYPPQTPNLTRLARRGVLFRNAFCVAPTCSPSRAALLTGAYPHQNGMYGLTNQGWTLNDYSQHLRKTLSDAGYETALIGTHHVAPFTDEGYERLGYDWRGVPDSEDDLAEFRTREAIEYLKRPRSKPFFLSLGYDITHQSKWVRSFVHSVEAMGPLDDCFERPYPGIPDAPATRREAALQRRATEFQDRQLGQFLDALEEQGLSEDTLVIYTTDHGPGLPGAKMHLNDHGLGVSLVMAGPEPFTGGKTIDALVSHLDLYPTLCALLDLQPEHNLEGASLLPLVKGEAESLHDAIFAEQNYHGRYCAFRSIRTERYRYIRKIGDADLSFDANTADASAARALLKDAGSDKRLLPQKQLYDLLFDPDERRNLIDAPAYAAVRDQLRQRLDQWMEDTDDPARHDRIPEPPPTPEWALEAARRKEAGGAHWVAACRRLIDGTETAAL